jgi:hypothetical protein
MKDSTLKKEFKHSDVERIRNLVKKDFTSKTKAQSGYTRIVEKHSEGEIWEEGGKQWTVKDGLKQNITKLDAAKKAVQIPLTCPKCSGSMSYFLSKQIYKINKMCFDCFIGWEAEMRRTGVYEEYLLHARKGNLTLWIKELEQQFADTIDSDDTFVTEQGDIESLNVDKTLEKKRMTEKFEEYITYLKSKL